MKILVSANARMEEYTRSCVASAQKLGYETIIYDLGGLGIGKSFNIDHPTFHEKGYYHHIKKGRFAPGQHKPAVVKDCLASLKEFIVYIDADTLLLDRIDEMKGDFDGEIMKSQLADREDNIDIVDPSYFQGIWADEYIVDVSGN